MKNRYLKISCSLLLILLAGCQVATVNSSKNSDKRSRLTEISSGVCLDTNNGLMWQTEGSQPFSSWDQAHQYAGQLEAAGFNDWRLPSYEELHILQQVIDLKRHGDCPIKLHGSFWLGNTTKEAKAGFWDSEPSCGGPVYFFIKRSAGSVIAVRSSEAPP